MTRAAWYAGAAVVAAVGSLLAGVARPDGDGVVAAEGAALFRTKGCATCHDGPDGASLTDAGPSLVGAATWAGERVPDLSAEEYVEASIRNPSAFLSPERRMATGGPTLSMPLLRMSDDEIDAIVAYLLAPDTLASPDRNE